MTGGYKIGGGCVNRDMGNAGGRREWGQNPDTEFSGSDAAI